MVQDEEHGHQRATGCMRREQLGRGQCRGKQRCSAIDCDGRVRLLPAGERLVVLRRAASGYNKKPTVVRAARENGPGCMRTPMQLRVS